MRAYSQPFLSILLLLSTGASSAWLTADDCYQAATCDVSKIQPKVFNVPTLITVPDPTLDDPDHTKQITVLVPVTLYCVAQYDARGGGAQTGYYDLGFACGGYQLSTGDGNYVSVAGLSGTECGAPGLFSFPCPIAP